MPGSGTVVLVSNVLIEGEGFVPLDKIIMCSIVVAAETDTFGAYREASEKPWASAPVHGRGIGGDGATSN